MGKNKIGYDEAAEGGFMNWLRKFMCNVMDWHSPGWENQTFDGCNWDTVCKHCGRRIRCDSQGNWYSI